jgi:hypothetical protein
MTAAINAAAVTASADERIDWRFTAMPSAWQYARAGVRAGDDRMAGMIRTYF